MRDSVTYEAFVQAASGRLPYPWQARMAKEGLPDVIAVETGGGKTAAVVLGWLWRLLCHPDLAVRSATPHWLVLCLPMRVLTEQVEDDVESWLHHLGISEEVAVHVLMGGRESVQEGRWRRTPERPAILIGTVDMLLSRALNRGFAMGRFSWPIDFGLLHNGCHWVFDEIQTLGPALATSRQLDGLRGKLGTAVPSRTTWMSATVDRRGLDQVDRPFAGDRVVELDRRDVEGRLGDRLRATRTVRAVIGDPAVALVEAHRPGTRTIAVVNTIASGRALAVAVRRLAGEVPVTLLHSRFRPGDRKRITDEVLGDIPDAGRIVIATQVIEAGVDVSCDVMMSELAPWPSLVQRAGRCNRDGLADRAQLLWVKPDRSAPYRTEDLEASGRVLEGMEGEAVTSSQLREMEVAVTPVVHPVLRRVDLLGLFDTAPDLTGNDLDVGPFIRERDDRGDVLIAWRDLSGQPPSPDQSRPGAEELCPAPADDLARVMRGRSPVWRFDHVRHHPSQSGWVRCEQAEVLSRPGLVVLVDRDFGCYDPDDGWDPRSRRPVVAIVADDGPAIVSGEEAVEEDSISYSTGVWTRLEHHLADVEREVSAILSSYSPDGLSEQDVRTAVVAGRLHDLGKAHAVFQQTMAGSAEDGMKERVAESGPWAKSGGPRRPRHQRRYFRHELVSALALQQVGERVLAGVDRELVLYLVAAHHGRVRMSIRSLPDEPEGTVLGVKDGDLLPPVVVPGGRTPAVTLNHELVQTGRGPDGQMGWSELACSVLERLGPFRLGFLEAAVRLGDWRASRAEAEGESDL